MLSPVETAIAKAPPILRGQAPGFFRYALGDRVVTAIDDGYVILDPLTLTRLTDAERAHDLAKQMPPAEGNVNSSVNAFIIHDGVRLVLVDAASAHFAGPTMGRYVVRGLGR